MSPLIHQKTRYVESFRALAGADFQTRYRITEEGSRAFDSYLEELREFLETPGVDLPGPADAKGRPDEDPRSFRSALASCRPP